MPCEYVGLLLQPCGFFDRNPAMNLPPSARPPLLSRRPRVRARTGAAISGLIS